MDVAIYQKAKKGNFHCGDSYFYTETENEFVCALADGLGSGEFAKESSQIVMDIIQSNMHVPINQIVNICNKQLTGKRGVVLGILKIDFNTERYTFSSIGNIGVLTITEDNKKKRNIPSAGYLAGYQRPFKVVEEVLKPEMRFIMFSDGVTDKDLSQRFFLDKSVEEITKTFEYTSRKVKDDDTTLIAMRYKK
ncbi:SpoIIE family protein phosphatase [Virgibacillus byunsanensis]|uniref:SpoIIE family protein phosphatase n=1 Tax=Virgibacillus byunsanensis TaxID=570945 RepID=A0ABW3LJ35_9BACI